MFFLIWLSMGIINSESNSDNTFHPNISIIISAHNEEKKISNLLNVLINQDYESKYEIIVANDRSTDNTKQIISNFSQKYNFIKLINIKETPIGWGHKKWALNECIKKAKYDIILQTDADCIPKLKWIKSMATHFSDPNIVFISGPSPMEDINNKLSKYYKLDSLAQDALSAAGFNRDLSFSCTGRNMGFLKQSFFDIEGYLGIEHYQSGDDDLLLQKFATLSNGKIKFSFNSDSIVSSAPPQFIKDFFNQRIRYASKGFDYYKLNTKIEFKILLPFLYLINLISLLGIILFIKDPALIYILPIILKIISDYSICSIFFNKINTEFPISEFISLSIIHPIYVVSLGLISPFLNYTWKNDF